MKFTLALLIAAVALAQPTYTTVDDVVYTPIGIGGVSVKFTGTLQISNPIPLVVTTGSISVAQWRQTIQVYAGVVKFQIIGNASFSTPDTSYVLRYTGSTGQTYQEVCTFPTSGSPIKLADYCSSTTPYSPPAGINAGGIISGPWSNTACVTCEVTGHKGAASGYASLDSSSTVPLIQIPSLPESQITSLISDLAGKQAVLGFTPENVANKAAAGGYASLDSNTFVPQAQLPRCVQTVSFSSTPAFDFSICPNQTITLTGNVSPTISNAAYCERGCSITFVQGAGSYTVTWPGTVANGFEIGTTNGGTNTQTFTSIDGSTLVATSFGAIQ